MIRMHLGGNEMHKTDTLFVGWMAFVWLESWGEKEKLCFLFSIHHFHALLANISWVLRDIVNKLIWKFSNLYNVNYSYHHGWCLQHSIFYQLKHFFLFVLYKQRNGSLVLLYPLILFIVNSQVTGVRITPTVAQRIIWWISSIWEKEKRQQTCVQSPSCMFPEPESDPP